MHNATGRNELQKKKQQHLSFFGDKPTVYTVHSLEILLYLYWTTIVFVVVQQLLNNNWV